MDPQDAPTGPLPADSRLTLGASADGGVAAAEARGDSSSGDLVLDEFLARLAIDRLERGVQPLRHYLEAFPEHESVVAREYLALTGVTPASDAPAGGPGSAFAALAPTGPDADGDGPTLGGYRLLSELGRGGQATVFLAEDPRLGRRVALKVVPPTLLPGNAPRRLEREARVTSQLEHPGICPVYAVGSSEQGSWIAMRLVEGHTLAAVLAERRAHGTHVDPLEDVALVEQVSRALDAAHRVGVVHRDVKPANIMVQPDGAPVVLDFGLAHHDQDGASLTRSGLAPGTPAYMAPEQLAGEALDPRCDVWALGVVLFEALTGRRPFEGPTQSALATAIEGEPLPDPRRLRAGLSRDLVKVLQVALSKPREGRYASAAELADDLRRLRERRPVAARPAGPLTRLSRWAVRNPLVATSLTLVLVVLAAATIVSGAALGETRVALTERTAALGEKDIALQARTRALAEKEAALLDKDAALGALEIALADEAAALEQVTRLADLRTAQLLLAAEEELWPAEPPLLEPLSVWLAGADDLLARRPRHDELLAAVRARLDGRAGAGDVEARWDRGTDLWLAEQLDQLLADLDALEARRTSVEGRRQRASTLVADTVDGPAEAWRAAAELVAADPRFDGLALRPQLGLVPLGPDPGSGLLECAVHGTGRVPERGPDGALRLDADSAIVLVLIPGGEVRLGAAAPLAGQDPSEPHVDVLARPQDGPLVDVRLDPYFIGKHELTQGQWLRHTGENPATYHPGKPWVDDQRPLMHPVETVTWHDARRVLAQLGLALPTEAQWERAARGGTTSAWWTGDDRRSIAGACNIGDLTSVGGGGLEEWEHESWLTDGWSVHAPVDAHRPNPFGLHGTIGNVSEWCADLWQHWGYNPPRDGDGLSVGIDEAPVYRGGNYAMDARAGRSASRNGLPGHMRLHNLGLRAARSLQR